MSGTPIENAIETLNAQIGQPSEPTDWFEITQERVNTFADATLDQQWIHVDPERAKEGPFGAPIAHGQLTLSIMSFLPGGAGVGLPVQTDYIHLVVLTAIVFYYWRSTYCCILASLC